MTCGPRVSFRYPWPVGSVEQLEAEMRRAAHDHGRLNVCGWLCSWLPDPKRVVRWDEAARIVKEGRRKA